MNRLDLVGSGPGRQAGSSAESHMALETHARVSVSSSAEWDGDPSPQEQGLH